ncbi:hypothetical protein FRB96_002871 [Tulasnella sp. 330]|nr:hypothetical protein FRB96_002871 [Tulasnella sp. 330]
MDTADIAVSGACEQHPPPPPYYFSKRQQAASNPAPIRIPHSNSRSAASTHLSVATELGHLSVDYTQHRSQFSPNAPSTCPTSPSAVTSPLNIMSSARVASQASRHPSSGFQSLPPGSSHCVAESDLGEDEDCNEDDMELDHEDATSSVKAGPSTTKTAKGGPRAANNNFVQKLYQILEDPQFRAYIHWNEDGTQVVIPDQEAFSKEVLPKKFKTTQFASFIRQMNNYNWSKINKTNRTSRSQKGTAETQIWVFRHDHFLRDRPDLHVFIRRKATDATGNKAPTPSSNEPSLVSRTRSFAPSSSNAAGSDPLSQLLQRVEWLETELRKTKVEVAESKKLLAAICRDREIKDSQTLDNEHVQVAHIREKTENMHFEPSTSDYFRQGEQQTLSTGQYTPVSTSPTVRVSPPSHHWNNSAYTSSSHPDSNLVSPISSSVSPIISTLPIRRSVSPSRHGPYHRSTKSDGQAHSSNRRNSHVQSLSIPGMTDSALLPPPLSLNVETLGGTQQNIMDLNQPDFHFDPSIFDPGPYTFQLAGQVDPGLPDTSSQQIGQTSDIFGEFPNYATTASTITFDPPSLLQPQTQLEAESYDHITNWPVNVVPHRSQLQEGSHPSRPNGSGPKRPRH